MKIEIMLIYKKQNVDIVMYMYIVKFHSGGNETLHDVLTHSLTSNVVKLRTCQQQETTKREQNMRSLVLT
jgi:hypothetical protein